MARASGNRALQGRDQRTRATCRTPRTHSIRAVYSGLGTALQHLVCSNDVGSRSRMRRGLDWEIHPPGGTRVWGPWLQPGEDGWRRWPFRKFQWKPGSLPRMAEKTGTIESRGWKAGVLELPGAILRQRNFSMPSFRQDATKSRNSSVAARRPQSFQGTFDSFNDSPLHVLTRRYFDEICFGNCYISRPCHSGSGG